MSMHPDRNYFQIYKGDCDVFIETGTFQGAGITLAIEAGFTEIHSIDIKPQIPSNYQHGLENIHLYIGDSAEVLEGLLPKLKGRKIMFWLDAHSQIMEGEEENFPLLRELLVIRESKLKNATFLIDDFLYMTHPDITGYTKETILHVFGTINPNYKITYLPNPIKNNILLAKI
jgi:hypothetical protein